MLQNNSGQSLTETVLTLPIFLLLVFLGLQICHLGMAVVITNYAAASIARNAVSTGRTPSGGSSANANSLTDEQVLRRLLLRGMDYVDARVTQEAPLSTARTGSINVVGSIKAVALVTLKPMPLMGYFLNPILGRSGGGSVQDFPSNCTPIGPVCYEGGQRPMFYVKGVSYARMNI